MIVTFALTALPLQHKDELGIPLLLRATRFARADEVRLDCPIPPPSSPFSTLPQNKDRYLTVHEARAYFHPDTEPRMYAVLAEEIINILDVVSGARVQTQLLRFSPSCTPPPPGQGPPAGPLRSHTEAH